MNSLSSDTISTYSVILTVPCVESGSTFIKGVWCQHTNSKLLYSTFIQTGQNFNSIWIFVRKPCSTVWMMLSLIWKSVLLHRHCSTTHHVALYCRYGKIRKLAPPVPNIPVQAFIASLGRKVSPATHSPDTWWNVQPAELMHTNTHMCTLYREAGDLPTLGPSLMQHSFALSSAARTRRIKQTSHPLRSGEARWWNKQGANHTKRQRGKTNSVEGDNWEMRAAKWLQAWVGEMKGRRNTGDKYKKDRK